MQKCKICQNPELRVFILDQRAAGVSVVKLPHLIREKFGKGVSQATIEQHLAEHESDIVLPVGYVKWWFTSDKERQRVETAFLARMSFVFELWDKYVLLSDEFKRQMERAKDSPRALGNVVRLGELLYTCLDRILDLQKERDVVMQVTKVVIGMLADDLIKKFAILLSDLDEQRKELIIQLMIDSIRKSMNFVKNLSKEDMDELLKKANLEYDNSKQYLEVIGYEDKDK